MPGYNPWDTFNQGREIGEGMRAGAQQRRLGEAYTSGGLPAMEQEAFSQGDARTGMATRQFQNEQEAEVYNRMRRARNFIVPAIRRSLEMDPQAARQFLTQPHFAQRYGAEGLGLDDATIQRGIEELTSPDQAVRQAAADRISQEFQGLDDPSWTIQTVPAEGGGYERRAESVGRDGTIQQGPNSIPGAGGFRPITEQERQQYNIPESVPAQVEIATGRVHTMLGRPAQGRAGAGSYPDDGYDYVEE